MKIAMLIISLILTLYSFRVILHGVHMFQQNGYKNKVHRKWIRENYLRCFTGALKSTPSKKPLVMTPRVVRLLITVVALFVIGCIINRFVGNGITLLVFVAVYCFILGPYLPIIGNVINSPVEKSISRGFITKAKKSLESMKDLTVIGITGSYGKTSVKFYLNTLLSTKFDVLATPESYNTPMGVVKTINTMLRPTHQIFLCEMGARNVGDIKELCDIVHPDHGIITSIGPQHLESFHTMENIISTKFELADALPKGGTIFLNDDNDYIRAHHEDYHVTSYAALGGEADYRAMGIKTSRKGTCFTVEAPGGEREEFATKLIGAHNVANILGAIAVAHSMGISLKELKIPVRRLESVEHRLQLIDKGSITIIDDAYNSNPAGAKAALDTLAMFDKDQKILITPGMVELGEEEETLNQAFGGQAAAAADDIILVGQKQAVPIARGIREAGFPEEHLFILDSFNEAMDCAIRLPGTKHKVILLENDLPDVLL